MKDNEYKIMLIEPPYYRLFKDTYSLALYPLSLGYLAGTIRKKTDWSVMAYNAEFNPPGEAIKIRHLTGDGHHHYINNLRDPSGAVWRDIQSTIRDYDPTVVGISAKSQNFASAGIVARLVKSVSRETTVIIGGRNSRTHNLKRSRIVLFIRSTVKKYQRSKVRFHVPF
jgi:hypothetical protein